MPERRLSRAPALTRDELPDEFTVESLRELPLNTLRRLADHRNGVLTPDEQRAFDAVLHEVMRGTAERVSRRLNNADWSAIRRESTANRQPRSRAEQQRNRLARRLGEQAELAEALAPNVDWSFAQSPDTDKKTTDDADEHSGTVSDLENDINDQVELIEAMNEIAEVSKRTLALEQERDLSNTRTVFFGVVVSIAVLVAGWAPLVAADDWTERWWIIGLTLATCLLGVIAYAIVRRQQKRDQAKKDDDA